MIKGSVRVVNLSCLFGFFRGVVSRLLFSWKKTQGTEDVAVYLLKVEHVTMMALLPSEQQTHRLSLLLM